MTKASSVSTHMGGLTSYVASLTSNGSTGFAPVTMKYGERPNLRIVIRSAHVIYKKNQNRLCTLAAPNILYITWRTFRCGSHTTPLACELYGEVLMLVIPYFSVNQLAAATNIGPLSVISSAIQAHLQMMSSQIHWPIVLAFSERRGRPFIQDVRESLPCTIWRQLLDAVLISIHSAFKV